MYPILLEIVAFSFIALLITAWIARIAWSIIRWKTYIWLPSILWATPDRERVVDQEKHLIFTMIDHYEPGYGEQGVEKNKAWLKAFRPISDSHRDSAGNCFRYTWFYPYEHKNEKVLIALSRMAYDGYGEVELHWHHPPADDVTFPAMLQEALTWFQQYGALISSGA